LIQNGKIKVHIEKTYSYKEIPQAIGYIEAMRTRGKVAMVWETLTEAAQVLFFNSG
jgi:NADPH:quinone reductase-like Zn-dependent oxidoreductase